jgi:hypothetical protein
MHLVEERVTPTDLWLSSGFGVVLRMSKSLKGRFTAVAGLNSGLILYRDPVFSKRPFFSAFCRAWDAEARNFGLHG